jgi:fumarylacetoacetate (FAA) hydrolase
VERRMLETVATGEAQTPFMRYGDRIRIEMHDQQGRSIFAAIDQRVAPP